MKEKEGIIKKFLITTMMTIKITVCYYALKVIKYDGSSKFSSPPRGSDAKPREIF